MKNNQFKNKITRQHGSNDMDITDKLRVRKILEKKLWNSKFNLYVLVPKDIENRKYILTDAVTEQHLEHHRVLAHPDIYAWCGNAPALIIEIDGQYHKDFDFDNRYEDYQINYIKINKQYDTDWEKIINDKINAIHEEHINNYDR